MQYSVFKCQYHKIQKKIYRKSDEVVIAEKLMKVSGVKGRNTSAFLNGKHNSILEIEKIMETKQKEISELSKRHPRLETLMYRVNKDSLKQVHKAQMQKKASGIDGVTKQDYEENLDANLEDLIKRMKTFSYRPQAVRSVERHIKYTKKIKPELFMRK